MPREHSDGGGFRRRRSALSTICSDRSESFPTRCHRRDMMTSLGPRWGNPRGESGGGEAERIGATPAQRAPPGRPPGLNRWLAGSLRRHGRHPPPHAGDPPALELAHTRTRVRTDSHLGGHVMSRIRFLEALGLERRAPKALSLGEYLTRYEPLGIRTGATMSTLRTRLVFVSGYAELTGGSPAVRTASQRRARRGGAAGRSRRRAFRSERGPYSSWTASVLTTRSTPRTDLEIDSARTRSSGDATAPLR